MLHGLSLGPYPYFPGHAFRGLQDQEYNHSDCYPCSAWCTNANFGGGGHNLIKNKYTV